MANQQQVLNVPGAHYATLSVHPRGTKHNDPVTGAVVTPISLATTFEQPAPGQTLKVHPSHLHNLSRDSNMLGVTIQLERFLRRR